MSALVTTRHLSVFNPYDYNSLPISIIGVGATGSRVFAALVELGLTNIRAFDPDSVEPHNLANQIFLARDVGQTKVAACAQWYELKTGAEPPVTMKFVQDFVPGPSPIVPEGVVFLLTDTMSSRREIVDYLVKQKKTKLVIETRMASSYGNIFTFDPSDKKALADWKNTLIDDDKAEVSACGTSISVGATASIIANMAIWQLMSYLTDPGSLTAAANIFLRPLIVSTK